MEVRTDAGDPEIEICTEVLSSLYFKTLSVKTLKQHWWQHCDFVAPWHIKLCLLNYVSFFSRTRNDQTLLSFGMDMSSLVSACLVTEQAEMFMLFYLPSQFRPTSHYTLLSLWPSIYTSNISVWNMESLANFEVMLKHLRNLVYWKNIFVFREEAKFLV